MSDYFFRGINLRQKGGNTLNYHNKRKKDKKFFERTNYCINESRMSTLYTKYKMGSLIGML